MALATNQYTIVDYNDALSLTCGIKIGSANTTSTARHILYDPGTLVFNPDWSQAGKYLLLTPKITKPDPAGTSTPIDITTSLVNCKWTKITGNGTTTDLTYAANGSKTTVLSTCNNAGETDTYMNESSSTIGDVTAFGLKVTGNKMSVAMPSVTYKFTAQYFDVSTGLYIDVATDVPFSFAVNGSNIAVARCQQVTDDTFYNANDAASLQITGELIRGTVDDNTYAYQWYKQNSLVVGTTCVSGSTTTVIKVVSSAGFNNGGSIYIGGTLKTIAASGISGNNITITVALGVAPSAGTLVTTTSTYDTDTGNGWEKLSEDGTLHTGTSGTLSTGTGVCTLTVYAKDVNGMQTYKIKITDTETSYKYYDQYTIYDKADPISVEITSPGGSIFKNSQGSTVLCAMVKRNSVEVGQESTGLHRYLRQDGTPYTVTFYKYDKDGAMVANWGGAGVNGRVVGTNVFNSVTYYNSIPIGNADVDVKATFFVEVT